MGLRDIFVSVPGIRNTNFNKKREIAKCLKEYSKLIEQRKEVDLQIREVEDLLGLNVKSCKSLPELCAEQDRLADLQDKLKSVYTKGKEDPTQLSKDELLTFQRLEKRKSLLKTTYPLTTKILAIRQGLMNIADQKNSKLVGDLNDKYMNPAEFIEHSSSVRLFDFLSACKTRGALPMPDLSNEDVTDLIISNGTSPQAQKLVEASPILKTFIEKLVETNERTGFTSGKYPSIPFEFNPGRLEGEILISEVPQRKLTEITKSE